MQLGQLPVTCGLFFSLGHSTVVVVVTVVIAISSAVYDKLHGIGNVGGIVGAAVSGSFLFLIGLANTVILWRIIKQRREDKIRSQRRAKGEDIPDPDHDPRHSHMIMMRILGPLITFVNRPWKMYPVGVLFGFGFDTASSIALLGVSALAKKNTDGTPMSSGHIIILPLLFMAGMTLVDSTDSILMLYSYSGFTERSWTLFEQSDAPNLVVATSVVEVQRDLPLRPEDTQSLDATALQKTTTNKSDPESFPSPDHLSTITPNLNATPPVNMNRDSRAASDTRAKMNVMSGLSIILTLMSILVAFSISLITIMGLIGENCRSCRAATEAKNGGGLAGSWWRGWAKANNNSGYIGAAIVGGFLAIVGGWYAYQWVARKVKGRSK